MDAAGQRTARDRRPRPAGPALATVLLLVVSTATLAPAAARADAGPKITSGWYLPVGLALGLSLHREGISNGFFIGGEASFVYLDARTAFWAGGYLDALGDLGSESGRFTIGPEVGFSILGVDGGYLLNIDGDGAHHGISLRFVLTFGVAAFYGRWEHLLGDARERNVGEIGLLLKIPIPIDVEPLRRYPPGGQRPPEGEEPTRRPPR